MTTTPAVRYTLIRLLPLLVLTGCAHPPPQGTQREPGTGVIVGKLKGIDKEPFDMRLADQPLQVKLLNSDRGVVASTAARPDRPDFRFENIKPGSYELTVYQMVPGKRTIAGDQQVTVDPDHTTDFTLTLHVTEESGSK